MRPGESDRVFCFDHGVQVFTHDEWVDSHAQCEWAEVSHEAR